MRFVPTLGALVRAATALVCGASLLAAAPGALAQDNKLRLITWADYVPADVVAQFKKETGIDVEITLSNNEEMISKLRATGGAGFDLAQPSQDRITGPQQEFGIYKPMDLSKIKSDLFIPSMLEATKKNTTLDGKVYGLPHIWGTDGLVVNTKLAKMADYPDLCKAEFKGKTAVRLKRPTLLAFAFASGKDPFALYKDPKAYGALMDEVGKTMKGEVLTAAGPHPNPLPGGEGVKTKTASAESPRSRPPQRRFTNPSPQIAKSRACRISFPATADCLTANKRTKERSNGGPQASDERLSANRSSDSELRAT